MLKPRHNTPEICAVVGFAQLVLILYGATNGFSSSVTAQAATAIHSQTIR